jgi:hypothetical protein
MADNFFSSMAQSLGNVRDTVAGAIDDAQNSAVVRKALDIVDPSQARLALSGLLKGGSRNKSSGGLTPNVKFQAESTDWRVKISLADSATYFYKNPNPGVLAPLATTGGVIYPYTPQISVTHAARYGSQNLTHSNYTNYFYEGSEVQAINITGEFTVQTIEEGRYVLACIQFFRSATKMFFGQGGASGESGLVGSPPPMVFLNGYGSYYFPNVPCVVTNFQHTMGQDVDYINVPIGGQVIVDNEGNKGMVGDKYARLPTVSTLAVTLQPIYSRRNLADNFSLDSFARGDLIKGKGGYI